MARRRRKAADLFAAVLDTQAAAWTTLGVRVPELLSGTMTAAERRRMVAEKLAAARESAEAVAAEMARAGSAPRRRPRSPAALMDGWIDVSAAALRPFHKRVRANAKRLGGRRRSG